MHTQPALADPLSEQAALRTPWWARALVLLYFVAGITGIAYEVLWVRMLGLQFGVSIFGVIVTVAAFMAGLGGGSLLGAVLAPRLRRPLLLFAVLEGAVAVYAWSMPALFQAIDTQLAATGGVTAWYGWQAVTAFAVLCVPALALGMGFPLMLKVLAPTPVTLARIYGLNTLGGALGALLPLVLLPALGWTAALRSVVLLGCGVAAAAAVLALAAVPAAPRPSAAPDAGAVRRPSWTNLLLYAGVGAAALVLEIGWTRLFGMVLLRTEYVLAILLCVFLVGIGLGSLWARRHARPGWLTALPIAAAAFALASLWGLPILASWADQPREFGSLLSALFWQGLAVAALTMPVTLLLGAWLPILSNHLEQGGRVSGAWLYGANSVGAAAGALVGGFVLIPWLGTAATLVAAALVLFMCGAALARSRWVFAAAPVLAAIAWPVTEMPPVAELLPHSQAAVRDLAVYEDALAITHVVEQPDGQRLLLADLRRMDASSEPTAVVVQQNQARLPLLLHPDPRSVLFLGLGTGISAAGALALPGLELTGVEISQGAIAAARDWFTPVNDGVMTRMAVVRDDARRYLRVTPAQYDVIIGDLFHPDLVGRGNLLSAQQFRRAHDRLAPCGVFVQWVALNQFDLRALRIVLRTFQQVYPESALFMDGFRLALVGYRDRTPTPGALAARVAALTPAQQQALTGGEGAATWQGRYWGPLPGGAGPVEDEWRPQIEFVLPRARYQGDVKLAALLDYLIALRPDIEQAAALLGLDAQQAPDFERAYVAAELMARSWQVSLGGGDASQAQRLLGMAYGANPRDRWVGFAIADQMFAGLPATLPREQRRAALLAILAVRPDHAAALKAMWEVERAGGNPARAEEYRARFAALSPLDRDVTSR